jgi:hypothetical protein
MVCYSTCIGLSNMFLHLLPMGRIVALISNILKAISCSKPHAYRFKSPRLERKVALQLQQKVRA